MSSGVMKLTLAAAAAAAVAAVASLEYASTPGRVGRSGGASADGSGERPGHRQRGGRLDVPPDILECDCREEVILAVRLALEAGKNMMQHYDSKGTADENIDDLDISTKQNDADFATAIDVKNEDYISSEIKKHFPTHQIIGEETTGTGDVPALTSAPTWIIDPIDGTTNFASGLPLSCVSIGLCRDGRPYMGAVYAPMTDELYVAVRGRGAYRNGVKLLGCSGEKASKELANSVVCFEFGYARTEKGVDDMANAARRLLKHGVRTTRTLGSGVLDICYVACGRMDVVYTGMAEEGWKPWDYCAGLVVAMEAGCTMTHLRKRDEEDVGADGSIRAGYDFNLYSKSMICGVNPHVVEQCRNVVLGL